MGWNFGCVVVEPGFEADEDALAALGYACDAAGEISFDEATSRNFMDHAVGRVGGRTVILGMDPPISQLEDWAVAELGALSRGGRTVHALWLNDASGTHAGSVFRDGTRVRVRAEGPGISEDDGAPAPDEEEDVGSWVMASLERATGKTLFELFDLRLVHYAS